MRMNKSNTFKGKKFSIIFSFICFAEQSLNVNNACFDVDQFGSGTDRSETLMKEKINANSPQNETEYNVRTHALLEIFFRLVSCECNLNTLVAYLSIDGILILRTIFVASFFSHFIKCGQLISDFSISIKVISIKRFLFFSFSFAAISLDVIMKSTLFAPTQCVHWRSKRLFCVFNVIVDVCDR